MVYSLTVTFKSDAHSVRLKPAAGITALPSGDYRLTVTGITDLSGNTLADGGQSLTFTVPVLFGEFLFVVFGLRQYDPAFPRSDDHETTPPMWRFDA